MPQHYASPSMQRARRRRFLRDPSEAAVTSTADIDVAEAQEKARRDIEGKRMEQSHRFRKAELAETIRARKESEALQREQIEYAREQQRIAQGIDLASVGLKGLSGMHLAKEAERQAAALDDQIRELENQGRAIEAVNLKIIKTLKGL